MVRNLLEGSQGRLLRPPLQRPQQRGWVFCFPLGRALPFWWSSRKVSFDVGFGVWGFAAQLKSGRRGDRSAVSPVANGLERKLPALSAFTCGLQPTSPPGGSDPGGSPQPGRASRIPWEIPWESRVGPRPGQARRGGANAARTPGGRFPQCRSPWSPRARLSAAGFPGGPC